MAEMGDHFWPSVYPGLALGVLYGLSLGGLRNLVSCSLGALAAAFLAFNAGAPFFADEGFLPMIAMLAVSFAGAHLVSKGADWAGTARRAMHRE